MPHPNAYLKGPDFPLIYCKVTLIKIQNITQHYHLGVVVSSLNHGIGRPERKLPSLLGQKLNPNP